MIEGGQVDHSDTLYFMAERHTLATFKLGVLWAGIWIEGTEFPGIEDEQADKIARLLMREAEQLTAIPMVKTRPSPKEPEPTP